MPTMPKSIQKGPIVMTIEPENFTQEKVLLSSLQIDTVSQSPQVVILYGRGRLMGNAINYAQIQKGDVYNYLSLIGADCECDLDRSWILGPQILMQWSSIEKEQLHQEIDFDVDNPLVLGEMSRILSNSQRTEKNNAISFTPETIDINSLFGESDEEENIDSSLSTTFSFKSLFYTLGTLFLVVSIIALFIVIYYRKNKN